MKEKFAQEVRFRFGVAIRETGENDGDEEGKRLDAFDYLSKRIVSIKEYNEMKTLEIEAIKKVNATISNGWITSKRPADVIYHLDTLQIFTGKKGNTQRRQNFGKVKAAQLINVGYTTVGDVVDLRGNDERVNDLCANTMGMKRDFVLQLIKACCLQVTEGVVEHQKCKAR